MFGSGLHLLPDVSKDHVGLDDPEAAAVDGHNRAVAAQVLAAAARFRVADRVRLAVGVVQVRVAIESRQTPALGYQESLPAERHDRFGPRAGIAQAISDALDNTHQSFFKLAAQDRLGAQPAEKALVDGSVEAVEAQMRTRVQASDGGQRRHRQPRRCMHGDIKGDQVRLPNRLLPQRLARKVETRHSSVGALEPGCGRGQPKRLATEFVSRNQNTASALHLSFTAVSSRERSCLRGNLRPAAAPARSRGREVRPQSRWEAAYGTAQEEPGPPFQDSRPSR